MKKNEVVEIDLREVFLRILGNIWNVIFATLIGALIAYLVSKLVMVEKFDSTTKIYVLNQQDSSTLTYTDLQTGTQLTKDYAELVLSRTVTAQVIAQLDLQKKYEDMSHITPDQWI